MSETSKPWTPQEQAEDADYFAAIKAHNLTVQARILIARHHLEDSLPVQLRRKLAGKRPCVILVEAPTEAWASALAEAAKELCANARIITGSTSIRKKPELTLEPARGPVFAISENRATLPPAVVSGADVAIRIWPSPEAIRRTLRALYGRSAQVSRNDLAGLDLPDIEFAMRPGGGAVAAVARMRRAARSRSTVVSDRTTPPLSELVGYGRAMELVKDIAAEALAAERKPGLRLPSFLLYGPPGVGKTLLVRSFARTVGLPLVQTSIGEWFRHDGHLGDVIRSARAAFDMALACAPSVFFIDEVDSLPNRQIMEARSRDWWTPVITSVLLNVDRLREAGAGVILAGATNHLVHLDPALVRPGRFDHAIEIVGPQTTEEVAAIFRDCLGEDVPDADIAAVARLAGQPTGAAIVGWVAQARAVAKAQDRPLSQKDLADAVAPPDAREVKALRATALHESAHAIVGAALGLEIRSVSIVSAGQANGVTTIAPPNVVTRERLEAHVVTTLAGRASDILFGGAATSGAAADLAQATRYLALGLGVFGFGAELVARATADDAAAPLAYDLIFRGQVETELQRLMKTAQALVKAHRLPIERLADALLVQRVLTGADVLATLAAATRDRDASLALASSRRGSRDRPA